MMYPTPKTPPSSNHKSSPSLPPPPPHNQQPNRRLTSTTPQLHPPFYLSHDQPTTMITAGSSEPTSTTLNFQPYYHHQIQNSHYHNQNDDDEDEEETITTTEVVLEEDDEKEYMFEKPLTPSDVGKLNRLVIPKQYAEKYFPLSGDSGDKGLLLSFEDESGKFWRFRYSYWNSSQSYVLTKGWSRFVKDKRLDAGDVVSFERRRFDVQRLFIRWRRRSAVGVVEDSSSRVVSQNVVASNSSRGGGWSREFYYAHPYPSHYTTTHGPLPYQPDCLHAAQQQYAGYTVEPVVEKPKKKSGNSKRLRLFGVNLECQLDD